MNIEPITIVALCGLPLVVLGVAQCTRLFRQALGELLDHIAVSEARTALRHAEQQRQHLESLVRSLIERVRSLEADLPDLGRMNTLPGAKERPRVKPRQALLGRFVLCREIGRGGMGSVYLAQDVQLGEQIAVKVLAGADARCMLRFRREAQAARRITHENVVRIHELFEERGLVFLTMEYAPGRTLSELLQQGPLSVADASLILAQVCDGLTAAHSKGVVHRDIKPENILVDDELRVKIIDFGLARASFLSCVTESGIIMGTPEYMSPEQVRGAAVDPRSDLYSLGCVAYHMLTGVPPFQAETPLGIAFRQCSDPPQPPSRLRPELPAALDEAILRALAKSPAARFASAEELRRALCCERPEPDQRLPRPLVPLPPLTAWQPASLSAA